MYRQRIARLQQQIKDLDEKILSAESDTKFDKDSLKDMKIDRNELYSDLRRYTKLQWEEDHERVRFEDDR
jgi:multidrug resistance efflux pump